MVAPALATLLSMLWAQELPLRPPPPKFAAGQLLFATPRSRDPDLAQTVVLIVQRDENGVIGLVLNHPSQVRIGQLLPQLQKTKNGAALVYTGGPLNIGVRGLVQSRIKPEGAVPVFADVYLFPTAAWLEKALASANPPASFHVYAGYTGWSVQQLRDEVALGRWDVLAGDPAVVFDRNPGQVWSRLSRSVR